MVLFKVVVLFVLFLFKFFVLLRLFDVVVEGLFIFEIE